MPNCVDVRYDGVYHLNYKMFWKELEWKHTFNASKMLFDHSNHSFGSFNKYILWHDLHFVLYVVVSSFLL